MLGFNLFCSLAFLWLPFRRRDAVLSLPDGKFSLVELFDNRREKLVVLTTMLCEQANPGRSTW
jgi:hypothetical protein